MKPQFSSESLRPVGGEVAEPLPFVGPTTLYVILTFVTFQLAHLVQTVEALSLFFHFVLNFSYFFLSGSLILVTPSRPAGSCCLNV